MPAAHSRVVQLSQIFFQSVQFALANILCLAIWKVLSDRFQARACQTQDRLLIVAKVCNDMNPPHNL